MPASAGRVRMPHNNRMSTSATLKTHAIWQTAIGHDPYANSAEKEENTVSSEADKEKARSVMEMARSQNLTDGAKRDDFTARMYQGLKRGKQRRNDPTKATDAIDPKLQQLLEHPSSSSEDEFVQAVEKGKDEKKSSNKKKKHHRRRKRSSSSDDDNSSSSEESEDLKERRHRREKRKRKKRRKRSRDSSSSESNDSDDERRQRKRKDKHRRQERKYSSHKESD